MSSIFKPKMPVQQAQPDPELDRLKGEDEKRKKAKDRLAKGAGLSGTILSDITGQSKKARLGD